MYASRPFSGGVIMKRDPKYMLVVSYPGHDPSFDRKLEKLVGKESGGSGFCLFDGTRDLDWCFTKRDAAYNASKKLRKHRVRGMRVHVDRISE